MDKVNKIINIGIYNTDIMVHFGSYDYLKEELISRFGLEDTLSILGGMNINSNILGRLPQRLRRFLLRLALTMFNNSCLWVLICIITSTDLPIGNIFKYKDKNYG